MRFRPLEGTSFHRNAGPRQPLLLEVNRPPTGRQLLASIVEQTACQSGGHLLIPGMEIRRCETRTRLAHMTLTQLNVRRTTDDSLNIGK